MIDPVSPNSGRAAIDAIETWRTEMQEFGPGAAPADAVARFETVLDTPPGAEAFQVAQAGGADMWVRSPSPAEASPAALMAPPETAAADPWLKAPDPGAIEGPPPVNLGDALADQVGAVREGWRDMVGALTDGPLSRLAPGEMPDARMIADMMHLGMSAQVGYISMQLITHEISAASGTVSQLLKMQ